MQVLRCAYANPNINIYFGLYQASENTKRHDFETFKHLLNHSKFDKQTDMTKVVTNNLIKIGKPEFVQELLDRKLPFNKELALFQAIDNKKREIAYLLINNGANLNLRPGGNNPKAYKNYRPIFAASNIADPKLTEFLLQKGADPNIEEYIYDMCGMKKIKMSPLAVTIYRKFCKNDRKYNTGCAYKCSQLLIDGKANVDYV